MTALVAWPLRAQKGFTLLELLVALSAMALLSTLLFEGIAFGARLWGAITRGSEQQHSVLATQAFLRHRLEQMYSFHGLHNSAPGPTPLTGTQTHLSFMAPGPVWGGVGGLYRYQLALEPSAPADNNLVLHWTADAADAGEPNSEVLLRHVETLTLSYLDGREGNRQWQDHWSGDDKMPALIQIQLSFGKRGATRWPTLIVRPLVDTNPRCIFDLIQTDCRA